MPTLSYQLYSSRNHPPLSATLAKVAASGLKAVEGYGALLEDADALADALSTAGVTMPTAHIGLDFLEADPARAVDVAKRLGLRAAFVPYLAPADRPVNAAGWAAFGQRVEAAGVGLCAAGVAFGWHNHDFELQPLPCGTLPLTAMLEAAPSLMLELDLGWVQRAGQDPLAWIARYGDRIAAAHLKDVAPVGQNADEDGWADIGTGVMDWSALTAALTGAAVAHWVLEHDAPSDDGRFLTQSVRAVQELV